MNNTAQITARIAKAARNVLVVLGQVILGVILVVLLLLPWLIRLACVAVWVYGVVETWNAVVAYYARFSGVPFILAIAYEVVLFGIPVHFVKRRKEVLIFGILLATGLVGIALRLCFYVIGENAVIAMGLLPSLMAGVTMIVSALRLRGLREKRGLREES